jgi:hypothetical protein
MGGLATTGPAGGLAAMAGAGVATTIFGAWRGWGTIRRGVDVGADVGVDEGEGA